MFGWNSGRKQLLQEFETHLEMETEENIAAGMTPEEARRAARKKFGNVLLAAEQSRAIWGWSWVEAMVQDVRFAARSLWGAPAYTAALVCTLVLGLASVTIMLAITQSTLLQPVPLPHSEQLVQLSSEDGPTGLSSAGHALSYTAIRNLQREIRSFAGVSGYNTMVQPVSAPDGTRITVLIEVTPEFFPMLGVGARLGRAIGTDDARSSVVLVNDEFWRERLHANPNAVGSTINVSGQLRIVIGVLPAGFHVPQQTGGAVIYVPISLHASGEDDYKIESAATLARLKAGVTAQQALADAQSVFLHTDRKTGERDRRLTMRSYRDVVVGDMRKPLLALLGGVGVLLLIACANAANLQIGRAASRIPEMQTRSALGASFWRLLQQLTTESILVSLLGAVLAGVVSYAAIAVVRHVYGQQFPRFDELSIHPAVLVCTGLLAVLVGVLASIAPALNIRRQTTLRFNTKSVTRRSLLPRGLVAFQIALTCILLVISGLFVRTLQSLQNVKLGFDPRNVTTMVLMPEQQNQDPEVSRAIERRLLGRLETLPGVQSVTMQTEIPFSNYNMVLDGSMEVTGKPFQKGDSSHFSMVSTNFVRTSGIRMLEGRSFQTEDEASSAMVVMVNEAFVNKYLQGLQPIGASMHFHRDPGETDADLPFMQPMTIIGVVENEMQGGDLGAAYEPMAYIDYVQLPKGSLLTFVFSMSAQYAVRSSLAPSVLAAELRAAVHQQAPSMVEMRLQPMEEGIAESLGQRRLALRLVAGFGGVALVLSAVGIYGVLAYAVAMRRREIGIRMALGSTRARAVGLVMRQAATMALVGLIPGLAGASIAGHAVRSFLYGVKTFDAPTAGAAASILLVVFGAAACIPAVRAAQVDPMETLRAE